MGLDKGKIGAAARSISGEIPLQRLRVRGCRSLERSQNQPNALACLRLLYEAG
jgi:hypothetical protein